MTRDDFIARWRFHVAGVIALGGEGVRRSLSGAVLSPETLGRALLEIQTTTDGLLGRIYDSLRTAPPKEKTGESPQPGTQASQGQGKGQPGTGPSNPTAAATKPAAATGNNPAGPRS